MPRLVKRHSADSWRMTIYILTLIFVEQRGDASGCFPPQHSPPSSLVAYMAGMTGVTADIKTKFPQYGGTIYLGMIEG